MDINLDIADEIVIEGDASRLIQVMVNLLSNAINYSKEQTKIIVSVKKIAEMQLLKYKMKESVSNKLNWHGCLNASIVSTVLEAVTRVAQGSD